MSCHMMKWYMKWIIYELRIWNQVKLWSSQVWAQFLQLRREAWKIQDFNGVWTRDLAIPVQRSNQLSYEATNAIDQHKWPAPNVSGFIAQLVRMSHRNREVTGSNLVEVLNFSGFSTQLQKLRL